MTDDIPVMIPIANLMCQPYELNCPNCQVTPIEGRCLTKLNYSDFGVQFHCLSRSCPLSTCWYACKLCETGARTGRHRYFFKMRDLWAHARSKEHLDVMEKLCKPSPPSSPSNSHQRVQIDGIPDSILPNNLQGALPSSSVLQSDLTSNQSFFDYNDGNDDDVSMSRNTLTPEEYYKSLEELSPAPDDFLPLFSDDKRTETNALYFEQQYHHLHGPAGLVALAIRQNRRCAKDFDEATVLWYTLTTWFANKLSARDRKVLSVILRFPFNHKVPKDCPKLTIPPDPNSFSRTFITGAQSRSPSTNASAI
jgi:hypothetical protein